MDSTDPHSCSTCRWLSSTTRRHSSYSNLSTESSSTSTRPMKVSICRRRPRIRLKSVFAASLRSWATLLILTLTSVERSSTVTKRPSTTSCTGCWQECPICRGKLTPLASSYLWPFLMSSWLTKRCVKLSRSTRIFKLSSKLCIRALRVSVRTLWIQPNLKKRSPS